ncbi:MAG: RNA polymerase subunit sigma [Planctomycetaceae bacterium]|nr:RNA polymerase subunit sigma [Planctomycetaceae bacterium]
MSGPIVRTGTTPEFWKNWDSIFGDKKKAAKGGEAKAAAKGKKAAKKAAKKTAKKSAKKK